MPTYDYICEKCDHAFEVVRPMSAASLLTCPKELCARKKWGRGKVRKIISGGAGLLFKGSGFYITDYRSEGYKQAVKQASGEGKPTAKTETKVETKVESKPAAKPEKK